MRARIEGRVKEQKTKQFIERDFKDMDACKLYIKERLPEWKNVKIMEVIP